MKTEKNVNPQTTSSEDKNRTGKTNTPDSRNQDPDRRTQEPDKQPATPNKQPWQNPDPTSPEKERADPYAEQRDRSDIDKKTDDKDIDRNPVNEKNRGNDASYKPNKPGSDFNRNAESDVDSSDRTANQGTKRNTNDETKRGL